MEGMLLLQLSKLMMNKVVKEYHKMVILEAIDCYNHKQLHKTNMVLAILTLRDIQSNRPF